MTMYHEADTRESSRDRPYRWWHAAAVGLAVNLPGAFWPWREDLFPGFRIPPLRPPGDVFPIIWLIIEVCVLAAGLRILNSADLPRRRLHIWLHAIYWTAFAAFPVFFFGLASPVLGATLTLIIMAVAVAEVITLASTDTIAAALMVPLAAWSLFAGLYVSIWQVLHNADPLLGLSPLLP